MLDGFRYARLAITLKQISSYVDGNILERIKNIKRCEQTCGGPAIITRKLLTINLHYYQKKAKKEKKRERKN